MPAYTYEKAKLKVDDVDRAGASIMQDGLEHLRMVAFEGPPRDFRQLSVYGEECQELTRIGAESIREVRRLLEAGPTNNTMKGNQFLFGADPTMAYSLNVLVDTCWQELKDHKPSTARYRPLWDGAAYAAATRAATGGVCAAISWVTLGVVTQKASNIMACVYYDSAPDHSYVLIRKRETPWFVVDPWVREPRLCPWRYNHFQGSEGNTHYFQVTHPVVDPFGQPVPGDLLQTAMSKAKLVGYRTPHQRKVWGHQTNAAVGHASTYVPICGPEEWGPGVSQNFRVESLWA
jgi:hypothetical protein